MNPDLKRLQPYPFEKLRRLKAGITPPADLNHIALSIGEPKHPPPTFIQQELVAHIDGISRYPSTKGSDSLREAIARWLERRYGLNEAQIDPHSQILPVNGTREALFAIAQALVDPSDQPLVALPNPFYQIYEGAALLAGAEPYYLNCNTEQGLVPDYDAVPAQVWERCQLLYLCNPGNPTGAVLSLEQQCQLIELAQRHNFVLAADECYSEIYTHETQPPVGILEAARHLGLDDLNGILVFNSLSKRSNLPGLRSGFVAGDAQLIEQFLLYRTYHGSAMPQQVQAVSTAAWSDEAHVLANRQLYQQKLRTAYELLSPHLDVQLPEAGFFLWPRTPLHDEAFAQQLFAQQHITVLPGRYLSRPVADSDPGADRVRIALVAQQEVCVEAAQRMVDYLQGL